MKRIRISPKIRRGIWGNKRRRVCVIIIGVAVIVIIVGIAERLIEEKVLYYAHNYLREEYDEGVDGFIWGSRIEKVKEQLLERGMQFVDMSPPNWDYLGMVYYKSEFRGIDLYFDLDFKLGYLYRVTVWFGARRRLNDLSFEKGVGELQESLFGVMKEYTEKEMGYRSVIHYKESSRANTANCDSQNTSAVLFESISTNGKPVRRVIFSLRESK